MAHVSEYLSFHLDHLTEVRKRVSCVGLDFWVHLDLMTMHDRTGGDVTYQRFSFILRSGEQADGFGVRQEWDDHQASMTPRVEKEIT